MNITVPTTWADVTLNQFIQLTEVPSLDFEPLDAQLRILQILTGIEDEVFLGTPLPQIKQMIKMVDFINHMPDGLTRPKEVTIEDRSYRINYDVAALTAGEYIDLNQLTKDKDKIHANMNKIIAVYLRPINWMGGMKKGCYHTTKEGHLSQTLKSRKWTEERIGDAITMDMVFPMSSFFLTLWVRLLGATETYFQNKTEMGMKEANQILEVDSNKSMAG